MLSCIQFEIKCSKMLYANKIKLNLNKYFLIYLKDLIL